MTVCQGRVRSREGKLQRHSRDRDTVSWHGNPQKYWRVQKIYGVGDGLRMNIQDHQVTEAAVRSRTPYMSCPGLHLRTAGRVVLRL